MYRDSVLIQEATDGRERQPHDPRTVRPGIQAFAWHAGGTPKRKQGAERLSQLFSFAAGLCLRLGHVRIEVWFNFSPNRMDPDFAKRLFPTDS